ncbi:MAG: hypothetical protein ABSB79_04725 [Syntrophales bacterium]
MAIFNPALALEERFPLEIQSHNVWEKGSDLFVCNSKVGTIESLNGFQACLDGFTRGVVVSDDVCYVGISSIAPRGRRHLGSVKGYVNISSSLWKFLATLELTGFG